MKTLLSISFGCLALFMLDALLLRFTHLSLAEAMIILACAISAMVVWATAMNRYIKRVEDNNNNNN